MDGGGALKQADDRPLPHPPGGHPEYWSNIADDFCTSIDTGMHDFAAGATFPMTAHVTTATEIQLQKA